MSRIPNRHRRISRQAPPQNRCNGSAPHYSVCMISLPPPPVRHPPHHSPVSSSLPLRRVAQPCVREITNLLALPIRKMWMDSKAWRIDRWTVRTTCRMICPFPVAPLQSVCVTHPQIHIQDLNTTFKISIPRIMIPPQLPHNRKAPPLRLEQFRHEILHAACRFQNSRIYHSMMILPCFPPRVHKHISIIPPNRILNFLSGVPQIHISPK